MSGSSALLRRVLGGGLAAAALAWGAAGHAAVVYDFRWYTDEDLDTLIGAFSFTSPDFIDARVVVPADELDSCLKTGLSSSCATQTFDPDSAPYDSGSSRPYDVVVFNYDQQVASRLRSNVHYFQDGAFQAPGTYEEMVSEYFSVLTVTEVGGVPEPSAWALMILGFGLSGAALRQRRSSRQSRFATASR